MVRLSFLCLICVVSGLMFFTGCHYAEMPQYSDVSRINFLGTDKKGADSDDPSTFVSLVNFGTNLGGDTVLMDTISVKVRLLGDLSGESLKITLGAREAGVLPEADIEFLNPYIMKDSAFKAVLKVIVKRPAQRDKEYGAQLYFDYANSDFASGIDSLQVYTVKVSDELTLKMCDLDMESWTAYIQGTLGKYSNNKLRFMVKTLETTSLSSLTYSWILPSRATMLRKALTEYNAAHPDAPLKDENGNLISFNPES